MVKMPFGRLVGDFLPTAENLSGNGEESLLCLHHALLPNGFVCGDVSIMVLSNVNIAPSTTTTIQFIILIVFDSFTFVW